MDLLNFNALSRTFLSFRAQLAAIAFLKPIFRFSWNKFVLRKFSGKRQKLDSHGSCAKSKNQWVENVSRTFLNFCARLAAIAFL